MPVFVSCMTDVQDLVAWMGYLCNCAGGLNSMIPYQSGASLNGESCSCAQVVSNKTSTAVAGVLFNQLEAVVQPLEWLIAGMTKSGTAGMCLCSLPVTFRLHIM